jgi:MOSC domain-containing protein
MKVAWLSVAPVKGLALVGRDEILLERHGVTENRRFYLIEADGKKLDQKKWGTTVRIAPEYDDDAGTLALTFPDGTRVDGAVDVGDSVTTDFFGHAVTGRVVSGPWSDALSEHFGRPLRLVRTEEPGAGNDRRRGKVSLLSRASLDALAAEAGVEAVDERRFRMLIGLDGCEPHEEDGWLGRRVRVGEAVVVPRGHVGRCAITTQDPDTGVRDLDTLKAIHAYREDGTEKIPFGVWGEVAEPGRIRVGDPVEI